MKTLVVTLTIVVCVAQALNLMPDTATVGNTLGEMKSDTEEHEKNIIRRSVNMRNKSKQVLHEMATLWCVVVLLLVAASGSEAQCTGKTSRVEFTVTSVKNGTTHRDVVASLVSEVPADSQEPQPVALKVAHWTQRCGGTETVAMDISTASSILARSGKNFTSVSTVTSGSTSTLAISTDPELSTTPAPPTPGPDYRLIPGFGFYKMSSDRMTWSEGRRFCEREGAHMFILRSWRELAEVGKIWGEWDIWTGVYRDTSASEFITVTGSRLDESQSALWVPGLPYWTSGDCVIASTYGRSYLYNDDCNGARRVLCFMSS